MLVEFNPVEGWSDWQAQAAIEQYREKYPDLTLDEEEHIYRSSLQRTCLVFRCTVQNISPFGFYMSGLENYYEITGCFRINASSAE